MNRFASRALRALATILAAATLGACGTLSTAAHEAPSQQTDPYIPSRGAH